jgi:hypothetical protein
MKSLSRLLLIVLAFSFLFFGLRLYGQYIGYNVNILVSDLGGLAYLYSTVGTIFAIFAAFVIVSESQDWNTLNAAAKDEVRDLNELFLWSKRLPKPLSKEFSQTIQQYLEAVINREWPLLVKGNEPADAEPAISAFHDIIIRASAYDHDIGDHLFILFTDLLNHRAVRIEYSWQPLPTILKFTITLVDVAVMGLSFFIGVRNLGLDYIFMLCIVTLGTVILMVVDDLDNPLRPGEWCLTSDNHKRILQNIRHSRT